jgi:hypothetical protein
MDGFNLFHPLPAISLDGTNYRPRHRGVHFHYGKAKSKLCLSIQFRRAHPGDATVHATLGLGLVVVVVPDSDEESVSSRDTEEEARCPS